MKNYSSLLLTMILFVVIFGKNLAQSYQGPDSGGVMSGVIQSTDSFLKSSGLSEPKEMIGNEETEGYRTPDFFMNLGKQSPEGSNYIKGVDQNINGVLNSNSI